VGAGDGCDKSLAWWFTKEPWATPKKDPNAKPPKPPRPMMVSDLPKACAAIAAAPAAGKASVAAQNSSAPSAPAAQVQDIVPQSSGKAAPMPPADVPRPSSRPSSN
jgi:penicillin-insensitive murein endopeptidase